MNKKSVQEKLDEALKECERLRLENERLRNRLGLQCDNTPLSQLTIQPSPEDHSLVSNNSSSDDKIKLFRSLFRGREDVYPVRWGTKAGKSGYSPACSNEWNRVYCDKPRIKCGQCKNRNLLPLTNAVIYDHLSGKHTVGVYPLLQDGTCWFLAADFDKSNWQEDVSAFIITCQRNELPRTVDEAVNILLEDLLFKDRVVMAKLSEEELASSVYLALAKSIRKESGLYNGNDHLITSCQLYLGREYDSFEDPAMVIIKELWKKIREKHHLRLVKA